MKPAEFPEKLIDLIFQPSRYKVAHGGRGGAKSWAYARGLLLLGINKKLRILCAREIQKSIKDSVHKLLKDQIALMGIGDKYDILDQEIRGKNGTEFIFTGLSTLTIESIKSYEGCDICWVEEGQSISDRSWDILIPTIRNETFNKSVWEDLRSKAKNDPESLYPMLRFYFGDVMYRIIGDLISGELSDDVKKVAVQPSEIWISLNPELDSDPTYERFVKNPPPDAKVVQVNWRDNPWFNMVLNQERLHCKETRPKDYDNIWEGLCKPAVEGAIFFDEMEAMVRTKRIRNVPYDPMLSVHVIVDLGFGHALGISLVQVMGPEIRVIWYNEYFNCKLSEISSDLRGFKYNWGKVWLPRADGFSKSSKGQDSAEKIMKAQGWTVAKKSDISEVTGKDEGIVVARERFPRMYWDKTNCARLIECGRRYRRSINKVTRVAGAPLNDEYADGGDVIRYISINANAMDNATDRKPLVYTRPYQPLDAGVGY